MSKRKNTRTLSEIADAFHSLERANIIDSGDLLIEGEQGCEHGEWLAWVATEVDISVDTARRYEGREAGRQIPQFAAFEARQDHALRTG